MITGIPLAIYDWIAAALTDVGEPPITIPVIWARQNAPRPPRPYVLIDIRTTAPVSEVEVGPVDDEGIRTFGRHHEFMVAIDSYATPNTPFEGTAICVLLELSLESIATRLAFEAAGFCFVDVLGITDLSSLRDSQLEGRAHMDLRMRNFNATTEDAGYIAAVDLASEVDGIESTDMIGTPEEVEEEPEP